MHEPRPLAQIDHELTIEARLLRLEYKRRAGDDGTDLARRNIDRLLDERLLVQPLPDPPPRAVDGGVVR